MCEEDIDECSEGPWLTKDGDTFVISNSAAFFSEYINQTLRPSVSQAVQGEGDTTELKRILSLLMKPGQEGIRAIGSKTSPCGLLGACEDQINGFKCNCLEGLEGEQCTDNVNDCDSNSCMNGGECVDGLGDFQCRCWPGWSGKRCEKETDYCVQLDACVNFENTTCVSFFGGFACLDNTHSGQMEATTRTYDAAAGSKQDTSEQAIQQQVFISVPGGGKWDDPITWNSTRAPNKTDYVHVTSPVIIDAEVEVTHLWVAATGSLTPDGDSYVVKVSKGLVSEGSVSSKLQYLLDFEVGADLTVKGVFIARNLTLGGTLIVDPLALFTVNNIQLSGRLLRQINAPALLADVELVTSLQVQGNVSLRGVLNTNGYSIAFPFGGTLRLQASKQDTPLIVHNGTVVLDTVGVMEVVPIQAKSIIVSESTQMSIIGEKPHDVTEHASEEQHGHTQDTFSPIQVDMSMFRSYVGDEGLRRDAFDAQIFAPELSLKHLDISRRIAPELESTSYPTQVVAFPDWDTVYENPSPFFRCDTLENFGTISGDYEIHLLVDGSVVNHGSIAAEYIVITGNATNRPEAEWKADQTIFPQRHTRFLEGVFDSAFVVEARKIVSYGNISIGGDLFSRLQLTVELSDGNALTLQGKDQHAPLSLHMDSGKLIFGYAGTTKLKDQIIIQGAPQMGLPVEVANGTTLVADGDEGVHLRLFDCDFINYGVVGKSKTKLTVLVIDGSAINFGTIENDVIIVTKDVINYEGRWVADETRLYGDEERKLAPSIESELTLLTPMRFQSGFVLLDSLRSNGHIIDMPSDQALHLQGPAIFHSIFLRHGSILFSRQGEISVDSGVVLSAERVIVSNITDLRSRGGAESMRIVGDIENRGSMGAQGAGDFDLDIIGSIVNHGSIAYSHIAVSGDLINMEGAKWEAFTTSLTTDNHRIVSGHLKSSLRIHTHAFSTTGLIISGTISSRRSVQIRTNGTVTLQGRRQESNLTIEMTGGEIMYDVQGQLSLFADIDIKAPSVTVKGNTSIVAKAQDSARQFRVVGSLVNTGEFATADWVKERVMSETARFTVEVQGPFQNDGMIVASEVIVTDDLLNDGKIIAGVTTLRGKSSRKIRGHFDSALSVIPNQLEVVGDLNISGTLSVRELTRLEMANCAIRLSGTRQQSNLLLTVVGGTLHFSTPGILGLYADVELYSEQGAFFVINQGTTIVSFEKDHSLTFAGPLANFGRLAATESLWLVDDTVKTEALYVRIQHPFFNFGRVQCTHLTAASDIVSTGDWRVVKTIISGRKQDRVISGEFESGGVWIEESHSFIMPSNLTITGPLFTGTPTEAFLLQFRGQFIPPNSLQALEHAISFASGANGTKETEAMRRLLTSALEANGAAYPSDIHLALGGSRFQAPLNLKISQATLNLDGEGVVGLYADLRIESLITRVGPQTILIGFGGPNHDHERKVTIKGDLINQGRITTEGTVDSLFETLHVSVEGNVINSGIVNNKFMTVSGDISNPGEWQAESTRLVGGSNLVITGVPIYGGVEILSNITFTSNVSFGGSVNCTNGSTISLPDTGYLRLVGPSLAGDIAVVQGLVELAANGTMEVTRDVSISARNVSVSGSTNVVARDSVRSMNISQNLVNFGNISGGNQFTLSVGGTIVNSESGNVKVRVAESLSGVVRNHGGWIARLTTLGSKTTATPAILHGYFQGSVEILPSKVAIPANVTVTGQLYSAYDTTIEALLPTPNTVVTLMGKFSSVSFRLKALTALAIYYLTLE